MCECWGRWVTNGEHKTQRALVPISSCPICQYIRPCVLYLCICIFVFVYLYLCMSCCPHPTVPRFVNILGPEWRQSLPETTIKTLTPNWDSSISPNAQNLSQLSEFSTNDGRDETKQDPNDSRSQILRQNSLRCFACFDRRHCQTNFGGIDSKDYDHEWF